MYIPLFLVELTSLRKYFMVFYSLMGLYEVVISNNLSNKFFILYYRLFLLVLSPRTKWLCRIMMPNAGIV